ncbi:hypothetical protein OG866_12230 [Streptomyces sp. NBC_00663]|uniref:hypothetical protein n=1 Tax=Streptomyces sp. NBC_00663 TaxID=2975801 RepID=UPI002E2EAED4|nr:hypothetical protein [Streptomyces sp. NBC_00663]
MSALPNNPPVPRASYAPGFEAVFAVMFSIIAGLYASIIHHVPMDLWLVKALEFGMNAGCGTIVMAFIILTYAWNEQ